MRILSLICILPLIAGILVSCGKEQTTGAVEIRWDRETCARCAMAVSDRKFSAQVRGGRADKPSKVYKFDDLGCAVIWLDKQNWRDDERTEVWVTDYENGQWIDARSAWYVKLQGTPMDYGLGAQLSKAGGALSYDEASTHIYSVEEKFHVHGGTPLSELVPSDTDTLKTEQKQ